MAIIWHIQLKLNFHCTKMSMYENNMYETSPGHYCRLVLVAVEKCRIILFEDAEQKAIFSIEDFIKDQENVEVSWQLNKNRKVHRGKVK